MVRIIILLILAGLSSAFYRAGGLGADGRKDFFPTWPAWLFDTKMRDAGCGILALLAFYVVTGKFIWWAYLLSFGLFWGSLSTYWDWVHKPEEDDFAIHGFFIGLSFLPLAWALGMWLDLIASAVICALYMDAVSNKLGDRIRMKFFPKVRDDNFDELSRGMIIPLLAILFL